MRAWGGTDAPKQRIAQRARILLEMADPATLGSELAGLLGQESSNGLVSNRPPELHHLARRQGMCGSGRARPVFLRQSFG
ncbi:hypothetical protein SAMN05443639_1354 [Stigmatella erecta]|uniref:Uncharacterized protein n=1 Tax=Stigmatella erecta TaxID=83460 RepID=A0A1I0LI27_9BACT|nr:hypothetical protein SAMN05443639_1354 [Stigmatella erecta]